MGGSGGSGGCCDCDGDFDCAEGACGGLDCNDQNTDIKSTQETYFPAQSANGDYDYNCNDITEQEQLVPISCAAISLSSCAAPQGFLGSLPPCGSPGAWGTCKKNGLGLGCVDQVIEAARVMRCR